MGRRLVLLVHDCLHRRLLLSVYIERLLSLHLSLEMLIKDANLSCIISTDESNIIVLSATLLADVYVNLTIRRLLLAR